MDLINGPTVGVHTGIIGSLRSWGPYTVFYGYMTFVLRFAQLEIFCSYKYLKLIIEFYGYM